jgi:DNA polymerase III gamma/tau subunit
MEDGTIENIAKIPQDLLEQLYNTIVLCDEKSLYQLIDQIAQTDKQLAQLLRQHASQYDYEYLLKLLKEDGDITKP